MHRRELQGTPSEHSLWITVSVKVSVVMAARSPARVIVALHHVVAAAATVTSVVEHAIMRIRRKGRATDGSVSVSSTVCVIASITAVATRAGMGIIMMLGRMLARISWHVVHMLAGVKWHVVHRWLIHGASHSMHRLLVHLPMHRVHWRLVPVAVAVHVATTHVVHWRRHDPIRTTQRPSNCCNLEINLQRG